MEYRREVDGLRAVAVLPVILFHAGFKTFGGGFVGVDVFFVISGYLITSIILHEKARGSFSLLGFYERRARRILPALFLVMLVCVPFAWAWMLPHQLKDFGQSMVATAVFLSNVFFWLETDYFNDFAETAPLLHTWTLAVEEQYYMLFPLLLMAGWKLGRKGLMALFGLLALASFAVAEWSATRYPAAAFYLLHTRGWELLIGVLLALHAAGQHTRPVRSTPLTEAAGVTGLTMIAVAVFAYDGRTPFPGVYALLPTLGAALVIRFATPATFAGRLLGRRWLVGIGLISYSAYLWHQPLFAFARVQAVDGLSPALAMALCVAVLPLSWLSWRFVETPARRMRMPRPALASAVAAGMAVFALAGYAGHSSNGFMDYKLDALDPAYRRYVIDKDAELALRADWWKRYAPRADDPFPADDRHRVLILGDSKSEDLYLALMLNERLFENSVFRRVRLDDECMNDYLAARRDGEWSPSSRVCGEEVRHLLATGLLDDADEVVLTATWQVHTWSAAANVADRLTHEGKQVSVVSTANFNDLTSLSMAIARRRMPDDDARHYLFHNIRADWQRHSLALKEKVSAAAAGRFLEKLDLFCDQSVQSCTLFDDDGRPYIYDSGHLTVHGAEIFGRKVYDAGWFR